MRSIAATRQAFGLDAEVLSQVVQGYGAHYYSPSGRRFARVQPATREFGFPRRNAFRQPVLEAQLRAGFARLFADRGIALDAQDPERLVLFPEMDGAADVVVQGSISEILPALVGWTG